MHNEVSLNSRKIDKPNMGFAWLCHLIFSLFVLTAGTTQALCPVDSMYQIGDSTSDTGNLIRVQPLGPTLPAASLPYGETFPGTPTGRWSDGRLILDFIAKDLGLPLLNPYLQQNTSFKNGVNFAVGGATALDISFLAARGVQVPNFVTPLSECSNKLKNALFIIGDIASNDIDYAIFQNKTIQEVQDYVPFIPEAIANVTREIIRLGGTRFIVPGTFPHGCFPLNLNTIPDGDKDDLGCLSSLNNLSIYYNNLLQQALASLRTEFPQAIIIYADYYNASEFVFKNGPVLGFSSTSPLKACCGIGGPYNFDIKRPCGSSGVPVCPNPAQYIQWDGNHFTEAAYRRITEYLITDILTALNCPH